MSAYFSHSCRCVAAAIGQRSRRRSSLRRLRGCPGHAGAGDLHRVPDRWRSSSGSPARQSEHGGSRPMRADPRARLSSSAASPRRWSPPCPIFSSAWVWRSASRAGCSTSASRVSSTLARSPRPGSGSRLAGCRPSFILPLVMLAGALGGAIWAAIPGYLKAKTGAHEVITTIMMNYIAFRLVELLVSRSAARTRVCSASRRPPWLSPAAELWSLSAMPQRLADPLNALCVALVVWPWSPDVFGRAGCSASRRWRKRIPAYRSQRRVSLALPC